MQLIQPSFLQKVEKDSTKREKGVLTRQWLSFNFDKYLLTDKVILKRQHSETGHFWLSYSI